MKSTGIVRRIDDLGRIVLPIELRRTLDIGERDGDLCGGLLGGAEKVPAHLHLL